MSELKQAKARPIEYPERDGNPMSDNTKQFRWIVTIKENLEALFADRPDVFVAGDLLWYPVEGDPGTRSAPDAMVAIGRPKGDRGSYQQWEEGGIAPQVVFEVWSPGNRRRDKELKWQFYETHGVEEYYEYDPDRLILRGWVRRAGRLVEVGRMDGWVSSRLNVKFKWAGKGKEMEMYYPDGRRFMTLTEAEQSLKQTEQSLKQTEQELKQTEQNLKQTEQELKQTGQSLKQTEQELKQTEQELKQTEQELKQTEQSLKQTEQSLKQTEQSLEDTAARVEAERQRAEAEQRAKEAAWARLRELGIDPSTLQ